MQVLHALMRCLQVPLMIGVEACFAEHADIRVAASAAVVVDLDADQVRSRNVAPCGVNHLCSAQISPPEDTVYVGNLVLAANDPALQFPPHIARAVSTRLHASLERMGLALPTVSSTLAQPDDAVDYAKRRSTNDLGAPLNSLAFCQASVDLRTALAQSTGGHHSMPSPAARPLSPLATMCAQWRWVAQVRAAFTALFCQLFEGWDMELEPHLDKVRSCTSRCCRLRVAYLTRKHGRRTPPVEVSRDVPSRVPAISACFFRDADILSVPGHRGRA